jgi:Na+/proline symporter
VVIGVFFGVILLVGLAMSRRAAQTMESYYLGGRNLPWYLLGCSGMSAWFDMTGTMIITSFLYLLGPRGLYIEFRGGAVLVLAFLLAYTAKWHRRSGCMTPAEWMIYRFGTGFSAEMLRLASAVMGIITTIGMLAYLVRGATLFMGVVFPVDPTLLTLGVLCFAAIYTVLAGFYGVVLTDLVQGCIMIFGCIVVSIIAWHQIPGEAALAATAQAVTGNTHWIDSAPAWRVTMPPGYEAYQSLMMAAAFYLLRSVLGGMSSGTDSRYFAARNAREASLQCLLQGAMVMFRWPLMISFAMMGIFLIHRILPDKGAAADVARAIHAAEPGLTPSNWAGFTSGLVHFPQAAPPALMQHIFQVLGPDWRPALLLIGPTGNVNPELILPAVLLHTMTSGFRGLLIVCLLAALMGALTGLVNSASALFVRDIYQSFLRPRAKNRELILLAYISSVLIIAASFGLGLAAPSINDLWSWLIMSLTAGGLGPGLLRLYWWRTNAWGMASGLFLGGVAALMQRWFDPAMGEQVQFTLMTSISVIATVAGSLLTGRTPHAVVRHFYQTTRPFGWWKPFWGELPRETKTAWGLEHRRDILTVGCTLIWQVCLFLLPMQFLTHNWEGFFDTLPVFFLGCVALYFFWWRNLPPADEVVADFVSVPPLEQAAQTVEKIDVTVGPLTVSPGAERMPS